MSLRALRLSFSGSATLMIGILLFGFYVCSNVYTFLLHYCTIFILNKQIIVYSWPVGEAKR